MKPNLKITPKSKEVSKKLLELKEHLDNLNSTLKDGTSIEIKKCTKKCIEVIDIAGEIDGFFRKR
jgi:hypothetical protein